MTRNKVKGYLRLTVNLYTLLSVCSAAVCDRANEFLQKSKGDMRHKKNCNRVIAITKLQEISHEFRTERHKRCRKEKPFQIQSHIFDAL